MAYTPKDWKDRPDPSTPLSSAAIEDLEARVAAYTDLVLQTLTSLRVSTHHGPLPNPHDVSFGPQPPSSDGHQSPLAGYWYDSVHSRSFLHGAAQVGELSDPPEFIMLRQPGVPFFGPLGVSTLLAADVAAGAGVFYGVLRKGFPSTSDTGTSGVVFKVGNQVVQWTGKTTVRARLCGKHNAGATALSIADGQIPMPSAGFLLLGREVIKYTGKTQIVNTTVAAGHDAKAGDTELWLTSVANVPVPSGATGDAIYQIQVLGAGGYVMQVKYTGVDTGNKKLTGVTGLLRNADAGNVVALHQLTGVKRVTYVETMVTKPAAAGSTTLEVLDTSGLPGEGPPEDDPDALAPNRGAAAASGSATVYNYFTTTELAVTWNGKTVDPDTGAITLTGVTGIASDIKYASALAYAAVGADGISAAHNSTEALSMTQFTGVTGFGSGVSAGAIVQFSPRERSPQEINGTLGIIHWDAWSPGAQQNRAAQTYAKAQEDITATDHYGGALFDEITSLGPNSARLTKRVVTDHGSGIAGGDLVGPLDFQFPWHVAGPGARGADQRMSTTFVISSGSSTRGWPTSGRFVANVWNRVSAAYETREFDYTGLGADNLSMTGVSYDGAGGYGLTDFFAQSPFIRLADRVRHKAIVAKAQVMANEGQPGQTTVGNIGPTASNPEPGIELGFTGQMAVYRGSDGLLHTLRLGTDEIVAYRSYVDSVAQGLQPKQAVRAATTANITLSGTQSVDGVALVAGDRVLVKNQTTGSQNGIYVVAAGAWARATDSDTSAEMPSGVYVFATEGTTQANQGFVLTTANPITLGTTALTFAQFTGAGQITAGNGLAKTGNTLDVNVDAATIEIVSDILRLKDAGTTRAKLAAELKPSGTAVAGDEALRALGSGATQAAAGDDSRFPTAGQKNALAGTSGTPGTTNQYVTTQDARLGPQYGTLAARPAAGTAGDRAMYFATDVGRLYEVQGGAWVQISVPSSAVLVNDQAQIRTAQAAKVAGEYLQGGSATLTGDFGNTLFALKGSEWSRLFLRSLAHTGGTANPGVGFTASLRRVTAVTHLTATTTQGTFAASSLDLVVPALNADTIDSIRDSVLADPSTLTDGLYVLTLTLASNMAANSNIYPNVRLLGSP